MKCPGNGVTLEGWLRFDTVYSPSLPLARWPEGTYGPRWNAFNAQSLENTDAALRGLMRLKLTAAPGEEISVTLIFDAKDVWPKAWMSQSSRVFDATESMEACEGFFIIKPAWLRLVGRRPSDPASGSDFRGGLEPPTIFFFFRQLPETVEDLVSLSKRFPKEPELYHFWSFDENGQTSMTEVECQRWHLPVMALEENPNYANLISWPVSTYADIQHWQKARGFKSSTADYALSMGIPAIDVTERIQASDHPPYFQNPSDEEKSKKPKFTSVPRSEGGTEFFHSVIHLNEGVLAEISTDSDVYDRESVSER
ncbi:hypothetical protein VNI00_009412 [Paramarasmius palmivorus]|uniref:Uncharacterized protein n=1 Tax=Paramarasmius palmivorus TaxID=297713 RepID=A0AAW0CLL7_9AGAR